MASTTQLPLHDRGSAILHILVVGFHHQKGATVEFAHPPLVSPTSASELEEDSGHVTNSLTSSLELPAEWRHLPHVALPDGCHNYEQDSVCFCLGSGHAHFVYGIACCRQIEARTLHNVKDDVTRSTVQKSVCILTRFPAFKFLESKLALITHAYFNSKDFSNVKILYEAYENLNTLVTLNTASQSLSIGLSTRTLVHHYQHRLLQIVKALLLQKRVLILASPANLLCSTVLSISSLFPSALDLLLNPTLKRDEYGFPLVVFPPSSDSLCPYLCLQQMDSLMNPASHTSHILTGVGNPLFEKQQHRVCDVFVHSEEGLIYIHDKDTKAALHLTNADLRFCSHVSEGVFRHSVLEQEEEPTLYHGSSEWVRMQYKLYLLSLLATSEAGDQVAHEDYNTRFMSSWLRGCVYRDWKSGQRDAIIKVDPRHPCEGALSLGDIQRRLIAQASDYGLKEEVVGNTGRAVAEVAGRVSSAVSGAWSTASSALYSWWSGGDREER